MHTRLLAFTHRSFTPDHLASQADKDGGKPVIYAR